MASHPSSTALDWLLAVSCAFSVLLAIAYLFYSNRILALIIGYILHVSWWNDGSERAWVSLESFQVSLLAGRIMVKDLKYHSSNQSFRAIKCHVTWRYWVWRTRGDFVGRGGEEENKGNAKAAALPCRLHVSMEGFEWRLYNRTAAYNDILLRLQRQARKEGGASNGYGSPVSVESQEPTAFASDGGDAPPRKETAKSSPPNLYPSPSASPIPLHPKSLKETILSWVAVFKPQFQEILPIDVSAVRGAIVCGNQSTPSLLVAKFSIARGTYGVVASRSCYDKYRTVIDANFQTVRFDLERNYEYRGPVIKHGRTVSRQLGCDPIISKLSFGTFTRLWTHSKRRETQYKTDDDHARIEAEQNQIHSDYAIVGTILETPQLELSYYWDEPGVVPFNYQKAPSEGLEPYNVGNGDLAPQYGIDLIVHGGTVRYGPWADRQRVELQRLFFPPTYQTVEPTLMLKPGDTRIYTALKMFIELRDTVTFHIPFKEPSKDWQYGSTKFPGFTRKRREGGWLELHAGGNSTLSYVLPWVATEDGYDSLLELHLDEVTALSSVNDIRLLTANSSRVLCQLPTPRRWNDSRRWIFDVSFQTPIFHVIRDHITLLTDLGKDWSSGPPSDFDKWIPLHYVVNISLQDFQVNLYLNDHNIITHPHARDANTLLTLRGKKLHNMVEIPSTVFRPQSITIPFSIEAPGMNFSLTLPRWNTHSMFATARTADICRISLLRVHASFLYYTVTLPEYIDQLKLDITAHELVFISFGWVVRHLMSVRDNYFGNFTHFSTLTEYVTKRNRNLPVGDPVELKWREGKSNIFEVSLGVFVEDSIIVLPAGLPGYEYPLDQDTSLEQGPVTEPKGLGTCTILSQSELQVQLRTHDYSMEMLLSISPVTVSVIENLIHNLAHEYYQGLGRRKLRVDGVGIQTNRLFGPQPRTSTYLCLWEFQVGAVSGVVSSIELRGLSAAITSFRLNFVDEVNAPASEFVVPTDPDVTFLKMSLRSVDIAWTAEETSMHLHVPQGFRLDYTDLASKLYKKAIEIRVPKAVVRALVCSETRQDSWLEAGSVSFDAGMNIYSSPQGWREAAKAQATFVAAQDALTRRAWFLYKESSGRHPSFDSSAYRFSMFLPRPKLPCKRPHGVTTHRQGAGSEQKSRSRPDVERVIVDDSDEDEPISEADRDARLAHSRPTTPLLLNNNYDEHSISSSDESDDGDVTSNISDSESDIAEQDESNTGSRRVSAPSLSHYRNIVRRFESHMDDTAMLWSPSLFNLIRDISPSHDDPPPKTTPPTLPSAEYNSAGQTHDESMTSTVRVIRNDHLNVLVTPLCMHVIRRILDEVYNANKSIELIVDSLTKTYLGDKSSEVTIISKEALDVEVSEIRLRILQSLMAVDEAVAPLSTSSTPPSAPPVVSSGNSRIVSDVTLSVHGLSTSFSVVPGALDSISKKTAILRGSWSRLNAHLDASVFHALPHMNRTRKVTRQCTLIMGASQMVSTPNNLHTKLGDAHVRFLGKASPEMVAASIDSLSSLIRESRTTYKQRSSHSMAATQHQIWGILQSCRSIPVDDPLTQTQPSFLVQLGRPLRMRRDPSWKLFAYLRYCLRFLNTSHRKILLKVPSVADISLSFVQMDDLSTVLLERLREWGHESPREDVVRFRFIRYCFPTMVQSTTERPCDECKPTLSFHFGTFSFAVFEHMEIDDTSSNAFSLGPFRISYQYRKQKITAPTGKVSSVAGGIFLSDLDSTPTRHHVLTAAIEDLSLTIHPSFIIFLQRLLTLHRKYFRQQSRKSITASPSVDPERKGRAPDDYWEYFLEAKKVSLQAAVESMVLELGLTNFSLVMPLLQALAPSRAQSKSRRFILGHSLMKLSQLCTRVRQARDKTHSFSSSDRDTLTSLAFSYLNIDTTYRITGENPPIVHGVLTMGGMTLSVPRSALLTYRLIEEWRIQYLPKIHAMTHNLFSELDKRHKAQFPTKTAQTIKRSPFPVVEFQTSVKRVGVLLQVMHGTWFSWDVHDIVGFLRSAVGSAQSSRFTFGVQLAYQLIRIGARPGEITSKAVKTIKLALPAFRMSGNHDGFRLRSHAVIDHFSFTLKPKYMDDILVVQQNLGTHFYDVLDLVAENRRNRPAPKTPATTTVKYDVAFTLQGFRVGIEGPTTTLDLTSAQMTGTVKNESELAWDFAVSNLALALSHHSLTPRPCSGFDRNLRSAYMVLDVKASSSPVTASSGARSSHTLRLQISRMHAVMSPNSIGELGDLIDHIQAEKHLRQEQRALELEEMKNKTKRVMRAFEMQKPTASLKRSSSLLDNRTVLIDVADIGIAFPLALRDEIEVDAIGSVPAFLMSIKTAAFQVKRYESGQASMGRLSFQFVKQFDQSRPSQFDGDHHQSCNRLLYPGMKAEFCSGTSTVTRQWQIAAYVDGFVLDLDPAIVDNVFALIDVYRRGRERVDKLTTLPQTTKLGSDEAAAASVEASYLAVRTSNLLVTLVFQTGKLALHGSCGGEEKVSHPDGRLALESEHNVPDVIQFPTITVWGEYRATPAAYKVFSFQDQEPSVLIFRSQVHTTINRIKPSVFPFLIGFASRIENRLRHPDVETSESIVNVAASPEASDVSTRDSRDFLAPDVLNGIQLSFSLRIDSSRLELDCDHDLGVVAALHWESGGFLMTLSPKAQIARFAGSVTGLQVDLRHLKHQAGTVQTARADARNLAFSVCYTQTDGKGGGPAHSISIVVDTEFGAALRFDRLQDILIFKAVYIDRLPGTAPQPSAKPTPAADKSTEGIPGLTTLVLVRARHIKLLVDLGHNVAAAVIDLKALVLRSRLAGSVTDLSLSISHTNIDLEEDRPLTGYMRLPNFSFATVRHDDVRLGIKDGSSRMLDVTLTSGALDVVLQSEKRPLLQYHAEPFDIRIDDDWTAIDWNLLPEERTLRLDFSVVGTDILAVANLQSAPRIIILLAKLQSDLMQQQTDAGNALATSSIAQVPKPDSALSEVADAMIRSARSKTSDGPAFSYIVIQRMKLRLSNLRVALFKNPNDMEVALFQGKDVHAELERVMHSLDAPPSRTLKLAFSSLYLSKYSSLKYRSIGDDLMATSWLERLLKGASEWTIARVPAMNLEMNSDVEYEGRQEVLQYDLVATADERAQSSRSIYVSLNLSLYIWAGALVKGLGAEIEKALMISGFNKPAARAAAAAIASPPSLPPPAVDYNGLQGKSPEPAQLSPPSSQVASPPVSAKSPTNTASTMPAIPPHDNDAHLPLPRKYHARSETSIDYGTIEQLGEATPDAKAPWLGLKETVPPRVHEYATLPMEIFMKMLLEVYNKQLKMATKRKVSMDPAPNEGLAESEGSAGSGIDN